MFYCLTTILSMIFYNSLICLSFVIEIFYFQTVPGTKHHRFIFILTFYAMPSFFRHQKDSGRQSIYKGENLYNVSCILECSFFKIYIFFAHESMKKTPSKLAHNRPRIFVSVSARLLKRPKNRNLVPLNAEVSIYICWDWKSKYVRKKAFPKYICITYKLCPQKYF